jgi:hypothetical protein
VIVVRFSEGGGADDDDDDGEEDDASDQAEVVAYGLHHGSFSKGDEGRLEVDGLDHLLHVDMQVQAWIEKDVETFEEEDEIRAGLLLM